MILTFVIGVIVGMVITLLFGKYISERMDDNDEVR